MVVKEFHRTRDDGVNLYRIFSDKQLMIQKVGTDEPDNDAIDVENAPYEYEETDKPIQIQENPTE